MKLQTQFIVGNASQLGQVAEDLERPWSNYIVKWDKSITDFMQLEILLYDTLVIILEFIQMLIKSNKDIKKNFWEGKYKNLLVYTFWCFSVILCLALLFGEVGEI